MSIQKSVYALCGAAAAAAIIGGGAMAMADTPSHGSGAATYPHSRTATPGAGAGHAARPVEQRGAHPVTTSAANAQPCTTESVEPACTATP